MQYTIRRLFAVVTMTAILFGIFQPGDVPAMIGTSLAAIGLSGLILFTNRVSFGNVRRIIGWSLFGLFGGLMLAPSVDYFTEFIVIGMLLGWSIGSTYDAIRRHCNKKGEEEAIAIVAEGDLIEGTDAYCGTAGKHSEDHGPRD